MPKIRKVTISVHTEKITQHFDSELYYNSEKNFYIVLPGQFNAAFDHLTGDDKKALSASSIPAKNRRDRYAGDMHTRIVCGKTETEALSNAKALFTRLTLAEIVERPVILIFSDMRGTGRNHTTSAGYDPIELQLGLTFCVETSVAGGEKVYYEYNTHEFLGEMRTTKAKISVWQDSCRIIDDTHENRTFVVTLYKALDTLTDRLKDFLESDESVLKAIAESKKTANRMRKLAIDIETFSSVNLKKAGVYKYVESPDFEILLIGYKYDDGPRQVLDLASLDELGPDPDDIEEVWQLKQDLCDPTILKTAYNAAFEITCLSKNFCPELDPAQWSCTMVKAAMLGLPFGLGYVADVLGLHTQKFVAGAHIKYFCCPCKPTKANGMQTRNYSWHDPEKWAEFKEYCGIDVDVEALVRSKIDFFEVPAFEAPMYLLDLEVNRTGVKIDRVLVEQCIRLNEIYTSRLIAEAIAITGVNNPKSVQQLKAWIEEELDEEVEDLKAGSVPALIEKAGPGDVKKVLEIRQKISKTSIKKYKAMLEMAGAGDRVRGLFQYYGANRTGRWAGRGVQVQNLVKNWLPNLDLARELAREGDLDSLELFFGNVSLVLSQLCRTAFVPSKGRKLIVTDFSAIEARVIAWLAGEKWRLDVFNTHGKIYEASGASMFKVPIESITKGSYQRDASKVAELALGFQGSVGALTSMIETEKRRAYEKGKTFDFDPDDDEKLKIVHLWRAASPKIKQLWYDVNDAAIECVRTREKTTCGKVSYHIEKNVLFCTLPSGRKLAYMRPRLVENTKFGGLQLEYQGMDQTSKKWVRMRAYGGLLVENITQAVARDLLAEKMKTLSRVCRDARDLELVMHVHDELVFDADQRWQAVDIDKIMSEPVSWAPGLPLKGDGFETYYYKKED